MNVSRSFVFVAVMLIMSRGDVTAEESIGRSYQDEQVTAESQVNQASGIIQRLLPQHKQWFLLEIIPKENEKDVFEIESIGDKIVLRGNNGVSIGSALNHYLKTICNCHISYCGDQLNLPETLPPVKDKIRIVNLHKYRVYYNYCTLSYTAAWWDWKRWEREIDFMALTGINMPLSVIGLEGVWYNTLLKFGYSAEEAQAFLVGPAYFAWQWMTNIQSHGGPLPKNWIASHIELGQKIIKRQRALGMTPIQQGFSGSMPMDFKKRFPETEVTKGHHWCEFKTVPGQLNPLDPMFKTFGKTFLEEEIRLFGTSHIYAADPFHEGAPPRKDNAYLTKVGNAINDLLTEVDSKAICAMQSWSIRKPIACAFPKDRLLVLDLAGYKDRGTSNFWGYEYVKGQLHNFGGRINLHGDLQDIANNRFAKAAKAIPNYAGMGLFMEGMVQNPVFYDIVFDQFWSSGSCDINKWLNKYAIRRYGSPSDSADEAWRMLLSTAYRRGTSGVENSSIVCARPAINCKKSGPNAGMKIPYPPTNLVTALELLLKDHDKLKNSDGYVYDVVDVTRQVLSNLGQELHKDVAFAFTNKDKAEFHKTSKLFLELLQDIDTLLATREEFSYGKWIADARSWGETESEKDYYEWNAAMLVTIWGPADKPQIFDYSWREWSGLIREYYLPRWQMFYSYLGEKLEKSETYEDPKQMTHGRESLTANSFYKELSNWEINWCRQPREISPDTVGDGVSLSLKMLEKYKPIINYIYSEARQNTRNLKIAKQRLTTAKKTKGNIFGTWAPSQMSTQYRDLTYDITKFITDEGSYEVTFIYTEGSHRLDIKSVVLLQEGVEVDKDTHDGTTGTADKDNSYRFKIDAIAFGAKYELKAVVRSDGGTNSSGVIFIKKVTLE